MHPIWAPRTQLLKQLGGGLRLQGSAQSHPSYLGSAGNFYSTCHICSDHNSPPSNSFTLALTQTGKLLAFLLVRRRVPRVDPGVHSLPAPCHPAPLLCLRMRESVSNISEHPSANSPLCSLKPLWGLESWAFESLWTDVTQCWPARHVG